VGGNSVAYMTNGAVVFAGGGVAGIAWEIGVLRGIEERQPQAISRIFDQGTTFVGTSAGSSVAAQVAGGTPLTELFEAQLTDDTSELFVTVDLSQFMALLGGAMTEATSPQDRMRRIGAIALEADTVAPATRLAVIDARLPVKSWPDRRMLITAVDAESGEPRVFDRESGVSLVEAVAASCAVPGVWPTVHIDGHEYMDGGMRTVSNADLAAGADRVLLLVPSPEVTQIGAAVGEAEFAALAPAPVFSVFADDASITAFGSNPLDPAARRPSALAGLAIGRLIAAEVADFWA
jgi:NTE family protein